MKLLSFRVLGICVALSAGVFLTTFIPLGIPGEWEWGRHALAPTLIGAAERMLPALLSGCLFGWIAVRGAGRIAQVSWQKRLGLYALLLIVSALWTSAVQNSMPIGYRDARSYWVLYDPASAGYFFEATFRISSTAEFLETYEERMAGGDVLHIGTHPPGLFLLSQACLQACRSSPKLVAALQLIESRYSREAFRELESAAQLAPALDTAELAALQLLSLITTVCLLLTVIPLAALSARLFDVTTAWKISCLWPTLPCLTIFLPKSDLLFPLTGTALLALMVGAIECRKMTWLAIPAGIVLWLGCMLSLAHLAVLAMVLLFCSIRTIQAGRTAVLRNSICLGLLLGTTLSISLAWNAATGCNIFRVWELNLVNHDAFYSTYPRTAWKWLLENPVELAFAVGLPVFLISMMGVRNTFRGMSISGSARQSVAAAFVTAAALTWLALWFSGKNQGEAARLWCFLTPWLLLASGAALEDDDSSDGQKAWRWLLIAQLLIAVLTVSRVSGFQFPAV